MEFFNFIWVWEIVIPFLVVLTVLVFVHELGHYWVARRCGVRVEVFSVGFGPEIKGWTDKHDTRWKICAVPLGGYVKMFGEGETLESEDEDQDKGREMTEAERAVSFHHKSLGQRAAIVFAGPAINFIFAIVVFAGLFSLAGEPHPMAVLGDIEAGSAANKAGLLKNDRILRINERDIRLFSELQEAVQPNAGKPLRMAVQRGEREFAVTVTPRPHQLTNADGSVRNIGLLGVRLNPEHVTFIRRNPFVATWLGVERSFALSVRILESLGEIITGNRSADELGGPLRIAQISGQVAQGGVFSFIHFMAVLSINLGLINLFPIPLLDGGHLAFYAVEGVRGRPLGARAQEYGFRLGLIFVIALFLFVTWNDLIHLRFFEFITDLFT